MMTTEIDKARNYLRGVSTGDPDLATHDIDPDRYLDHNSLVPHGALAFWKYVDSLSKEGPDVRLLRVLQDGDLVVTQTEGDRDGRQVFFDVFRFDGGSIVEHWLFSAPGAPPNLSGHTQSDGPTKPRHPDLTETNKRTVRDYYETVHLGGRHEEARRWFLGDLMIRHEPGVADGCEEFLRDLSMLIRDRTIDELRLFVGEGDLVFLVAKGTHQREPCAYVDLYRVEQEKVVEHWGFPELFPPYPDRESDGGLL